MVVNVTEHVKIYSASIVTRILLGKKLVMQKREKIVGKTIGILQFRRIVNNISILENNESLTELSIEYGL